MNDSSPRAVRVAGLVKRYGDRTAVDGLSLEVTQGEVFGLLGPNGAGKTTTIETIVGLRSATEGKVEVLGLDPVTDRTELRRSVGIQPQQAALFDHLTVTELLRLWRSFYQDGAEVDDVIVELGLQECRTIRIGRLSGGQRQRVLVAASLISRPRLLVLDEPATGLDPNARQELWQAIRNHRGVDRTVLMSTHSMEEAESLCDRVAIVDHGRVIACGTPESLVRQHCASHDVTFTVAAPGAVDGLRALPSVKGVETETEQGRIRVRVQTGDPDATLRAVLDRVPGAQELGTRSPGLDGVFRKLTGRQYENAA
ncbi:ABC transporter ATP-binding protein [Streptomyces roseoverticillatus]|uniref:ABC transporter ATP-binding protein n=1 Tax=Streptomyces roseoverticillatus TaxID=66429 RepID=UPI0033DD2CD9